MLWPDVADERLMELRRRGVDAQPRVDWRSNGTFVSLLFFVLTSIAVGALFGFLTALDLPHAGVVTGLCAVSVAELLIVRRRFFGTGVESALWLWGVFAVISGLPGDGRAEALLLFAAGSAMAGFRVRNALIGALAVVFVIAWAFVREAPGAAASIAAAVSFLALGALGREWQRPSTERLWIALLIIPPVAGAIPSLGVTPVWWAALYAAMTVGCLAMGIRLRMHAPLIGAAVYAVITTAKLEAHDLLPLAPEWRLIAGGAMLLAASGLIGRALRDRTRGLVLTPEAVTGVDDEVQILATLAAQPRVTPVEETRGGGRFGGGGATGGY